MYLHPSIQSVNHILSLGWRAPFTSSVNTGAPLKRRQTWQYFPSPPYMVRALKRPPALDLLSPCTFSQLLVQAMPTLSAFRSSLYAVQAFWTYIDTQTELNSFGISQAGQW